MVEFNKPFSWQWTTAHHYSIDMSCPKDVRLRPCFFFLSFSSSSLGCHSSKHKWALATLINLHFKIINHDSWCCNRSPAIAASASACGGVTLPENHWSVRYSLAKECGPRFTEQPWSIFRRCYFVCAAESVLRMLFETVNMSRVGCARVRAENKLNFANIVIEIILAVSFDCLLSFSTYNFCAHTRTHKVQCRFYIRISSVHCCLVLNSMNQSNLILVYNRFACSVCILFDINHRTQINRTSKIERRVLFKRTAAAATTITTTVA